ncbi:hypothetical protein E2C01_089088 [Portunus trituberculatus]|uniref:Uncharacterized protein n=1 Tax=Portunus trituberculatus TaxID=210409 RepID=A0A5B7JB19_PORTR|nr:hypothetical protein [Portunus trituberculatus]
MGIVREAAHLYEDFSLRSTSRSSVVRPFPQRYTLRAGNSTHAPHLHACHNPPTHSHTLPPLTNSHT